jgi:hypothetical protein
MGERSAYEATAAHLGMQAATKDTHRRCRLVADQVQALMVGLTVQEAVSVMCLCMGETMALLARHDVPKAIRHAMPAVAAHAAACAPGRRRWGDQITPEDMATDAKAARDD